VHPSVRRAPRGPARARRVGRGARSPSIAPNRRASGPPGMPSSSTAGVRRSHGASVVGPPAVKRMAAGRRAARQASSVVSSCGRWPAVPLLGALLLIVLAVPRRVRVRGADSRRRVRLRYFIGAAALRSQGVRSVGCSSAESDIAAERRARAAPTPHKVTLKLLSEVTPRGRSSSDNRDARRGSRNAVGENAPVGGWAEHTAEHTDDV
jgi:hypothetical protein